MTKGRSAATASRLIPPVSQMAAFAVPQAAPAQDLFDAPTLRRQVVPATIESPPPRLLTSSTGGVE